MASLRLSIEPIPASSRLASLANLLPADQWDRLRRAVYRQARYRCQVCGREGRLHCHEVWQYNQATGCQWLSGFLALCDACHGVKHLSFASDPARRSQLLRHFAAVNRLTPDQAEAHLAVACQRQGVLDLQTWKVSYGPYNLSVPCLRDTRQRRAFLRSSGRCGFAAPLSRTPSDSDSFWRDDGDY